MDFSGICTSIGNTPLFELTGLGKEGVIYAKAEYMNPGGSVKDRTALYLLEGALLRGELKPCGEVVEASSGNLGISLAMLGASMGLKVRIVMPDSASRERADMIRAFGAEVIYTAGAHGMSGALREAERLARRTGAFFPRQFENRDGVLAHYETTAPEIYNALLGVPDIFVAGVGSGGTLTGVAKYLKEHGECEVVAVEPRESAVLSGGKPSAHGIQGIGADFLPKILDRRLIDRVMTVSLGEAEYYFSTLPSRYGVAVGLSSGAAIAAAVSLSREEQNRGKRIVVILPDGRERYLSLSV